MPPSEELEFRPTAFSSVLRGAGRGFTSPWRAERPVWVSFSSTNRVAVMMKQLSPLLAPHTGQVPVLTRPLGRTNGTMLPTLEELERRRDTLNPLLLPKIFPSVRLLTDSSCGTSPEQTGSQHITTASQRKGLLNPL